MWSQKNQGVNAKDQTFGYVGEDGEDAGGYFFTWHSTLSATLASIEADTTDRPRRMKVHTAEKEVRRLWREDRQKPGHCSLIPGQSWNPDAVRSKRFPQSAACPA